MGRWGGTALPCRVGTSALSLSMVLAGARSGQGPKSLRRIGCLHRGRVLGVGRDDPGPKPLGGPPGACERGVQAWDQDGSARGDRYRVRIVPDPLPPLPAEDDR